MLRLNRRHANLLPRSGWRAGAAVQFLILFSLYFLWSATWPSKLQNNNNPHARFDLVPSLEEQLSATMQGTPAIEKYSLTVVLPVIASTLPNLGETLAPFIYAPDALREVVVICPRSLLSDTHRQLRYTLSFALRVHPDISVHPLPDLVDHHRAALAAISLVKSEWILLLDEFGLKDISECARDYLLNPRVFPLPVGPRGTNLLCNSSTLSPGHPFQPAAHLVPPFVVRSNLMSGWLPPLQVSDLWSAFGEFVSQSSLDMVGGVIIAHRDKGLYTSTDRTNANPLESQGSGADHDHEKQDNLGDTLPRSTGFVGFVFPLEEDLRKFLPTACKILLQGYTLLAFLYNTTGVDAITHKLTGDGCTVQYHPRSDVTFTFSHWLNSLSEVPDVVIGLDEQDSVSATFSLTLERHPYLNTTLIRLPRSSLPHTEWMGSLTLQELRYWNVPEVTVSVITNDRPHSLQRLLTSIQETLFYGDKVALRINMDQTSDPETMRMVQNFDWEHGEVFIHHRVLHGGLLPAVVESWYPHCNDSYGLLLEDDVELSPLSYAWAKMALLRYRYGEASGTSSNLFGISLYQQRNIELRPEGRRPFDARTLFQSNSLRNPTTPYLSQIPCSWGAIYFPSPWREFHDYLSLRLSQDIIPMTTTIVPHVRSNKWTKSWKKYFIELVYLRGYLMLYPNYEDFVSFSTNHLEVGSHVRSQPEGEYERKKKLFRLPLMPLPGVSSDKSPNILDLPGGTLPSWSTLPVLDLMGELSSMDTIEQRGALRRAELHLCSDTRLLPLTLAKLLCDDNSYV
ncbi:hypothetical protein F5I97DRAFT_1876012 [Phlebopus sp. FC_14]|nr:hypothetical protein F5I97DRAFT_1876012 [Phlebopus sp. FC_14]